LLGQAVELSGFDVRLELSIPSARVEFGEPLAKGREFRRRELANLAYDVLHAAHEATLFHYIRLTSTMITTDPRRGAPLTLDADH
jgi:hypothetical protein